MNLREQAPHAVVQIEDAGGVERGFLCDWVWLAPKFIEAR